MDLTPLERRITRLEHRERRLSSADETMGRLIGAYLALPNLRGFWPFSSVDNSSNVYDLSGQGRTLTPNSISFSSAFQVYNNTIPYVTLDGSADYFSRADEAGLEHAGSLTIGCWVRFNATPVNGGGIIGKYLTTGDVRSYGLFSVGGSQLQFGVSDDGTNAVGHLSTVTSSAVATGVWYFLTGRFTSGSEVALYLNRNRFTDTTSLTAAANNASAFEIGRRNAAGTFNNIDVCLGYLASAALPEQIIYDLYASSAWAFR